MKTVVAKVGGFYASSIGKKTVVAVTGILLLLFLLGHLIGNLLIYIGPETINAYGQKLHGMGPLLWLVRIGLLVIFVAHVVGTIQLVKANRAARSSRYECNDHVQASRASRTMIVSGLIILCFVVYHILHFTVGAVDPSFLGYEDAAYLEKTGEHRHDVFRMVVTGFSHPLVSGFYILSMTLLCLHLSHGFASVFQTLGMRTEKTWPIIRMAGWAYAAVIFIGNISIPIAVLTGFVSLPAS